MPGAGDPPWHAFLKATKEECLQHYNSVPAASVLFGFVLFGLSALDIGTQFSGSPLLGHRRSLITTDEGVGTESCTQPMLRLGLELPWVSVLGRDLSRWMNMVMEETRRGITPGVMVRPHFGLLQVKTKGLHALWGFGCHSASLITADVQALACSAFECLSV